MPAHPSAWWLLPTSRKAENSGSLLGMKQGISAAALNNFSFPKIPSTNINQSTKHHLIINHINRYLQYPTELKQPSHPAKNSRELPPRS